MSGVLAVARRELKTFFASPIAYVVLGAFLVIAGGLYFSTLFVQGQASLRAFFGIAPFVFVLIIPAITMRSIAEERKSGTLELLLTMPIDNWQVVAGKFLAALGMLSVGLLFTVPYALTVSSLVATGVTFDWGPVVAGYLGLLFLASALIALGLWASALSKNQIVGFVIGLVVSFGFYLIDKLAILMPEALGPVFEYLSVDYHFENIARGVLDSRDVLFYLSLTLAGLLLTNQVVANIRAELTTKSVASPTVFTAAVIGSLVLLNVLSLRAFARVDLTADRAYTLADASKDTLKALDEQVTITAYFTSDLPAQYASSARYVRDLLEEFRATSKGKVSFEFIDPAAQETEKDKEAKREVKRDIFGRTFREQTALEKELTAQGIQPVEIRVVQDDQAQTKRAYLGLVIRHHEKREVIPVVQNLASLEYELTTLIRKLVRTKTPVLALLQGHDEPKQHEKLRQLTNLLSQTYELRPVELQGKARFDAEVDGLLVIGPERPLAPSELQAIDQLLMEGKPVAVFVDSVHVDMRTFEQKPADHGLTSLLGSYGVTLTEQMVADVSSANLTLSEQRGFMMVQQPVPYPFIPIVKRLEGDSPITKGIGDVTFPWAARLTVADGGADKKVAVLARSSPKSWSEGKPQNLDPRRDWRSENVTLSGPHDLMVQVSGKLKSAYAADAQQSAPGQAPLLSESKGESRLVVAGTSALFNDDFMNRQNAALLLNLTDWMMLDPALLAMRTRGLQLAPLKADLPDATRALAKYGNMFGLPLALAMLGLVRWRMREARRTGIAL